MAWTLPEMRLLLFDDTVPYAWSDALINQILAEEPNVYLAAAKLIRAYCVKAMRQLDSYRMTDGKQITRVNLAQLRALADEYEDMAKSVPADALVPSKFAVDDATGTDLTDYGDDE